VVKAVSGWGIDGAGMKKQPGSRVVFGLKIKFLLLTFHPLTLLLIGSLPPILEQTNSKRYKRTYKENY
jgi:hypothetical protein